MLEGSVPGLFCISWKTATRKLPAFEVVADAFTANTFACAGLIAAITGCEVFFFLTLHGQLLSMPQFNHMIGFSSHGVFSELYTKKR